MRLPCEDVGAQRASNNVTYQNPVRRQPPSTSSLNLTKMRHVIAIRQSRCDEDVLLAIRRKATRKVVRLIGSDVIKVDSHGLPLLEDMHKNLVRWIDILRHGGKADSLVSGRLKEKSTSGRDSSERRRNELRRCRK